MPLSNEEKILKAGKAIDKAFNVLTKPARTRQLSTEIKDKIIKRSKLGFGVAPSGQQRKFPKLKPSYIDQRKGIAYYFTNKDGKVIRVDRARIKTAKPSKSSIIKRKKGKLIGLFSLQGAAKPKKPKKSTITRKRASNLHHSTTPAKSNITATGLLLNSLTSRGKKSQAIIILNSKRYTNNIGGFRIKKPSTTTKVNKFLEAQNRRWFILSTSQKNKLQRDLGIKLKKLASTFL